MSPVSPFLPSSRHTRTEPRLLTPLDLNYKFYQPPYPPLQHTLDSRHDLFRIRIDCRLTPRALVHRVRSRGIVIRCRWGELDMYRADQLAFASRPESGGAIIGQSVNSGQLRMSVWLVSG
jgi:hypothetical protein